MANKSRYKYHINRDIDKDSWNWYGASQNISHGFDWRNNIYDDKDRTVFDQIKKLDEIGAMSVLREYISEKYIRQAEKINNFEETLSQELDIKLDQACDVIEKITNRKLYIKEFSINLTTFPRCPYNHKVGTIFIYISEKASRKKSIDLFMHEVLHFQFHHYWQENSESPVSKLSHSEFNFLKESLTVILDDDLKPLIDSADRGYPAHQEFRKELHKEWLRHNDFDKLVDSGLKKLPEFLSKG